MQLHRKESSSASATSRTETIITSTLNFCFRSSICYIHHYPTHHYLLVPPFKINLQSIKMTIPSVSNGAAEIIGPSPDILNSRTSRKLEHDSDIDIIDIRHHAVEINLKDEIMSSLRAQSGPKSMPTLLLYDERGLQLFEEVSRTN